MHRMLQGPSPVPSLSTESSIGLGNTLSPPGCARLESKSILDHGGQPCPSRNHGGPTEQGSEEDDNDSWEDESESIAETEEVIPVLAGPDACVVVDKSGVHRIRIRPCQCPGCPSLDLQFLDMGLFPCITEENTDRLYIFRSGRISGWIIWSAKTAGLNYYNKLPPADIQHIS